MAAAEQSTDRSWRAARPTEAVVWLSALEAPWWIAGGWSLDLFAGYQSRTHKDLDIGILRRDALGVISALRSWEFFEAKDGTLSRLGAGAAPRANVNSLWCRPQDSTQWQLELMLDESVDGHWVFRREPRIQRPLAAAVRRNAEGIPYLAPEIQLLFKARAMRALDQADFDHIAPRLDADARAWLQRSLELSDPDHVWLSALEANRGHES
jgi:hypothetical protein